MGYMFTHLHVHSEFSLLDGLPKIDNMVAYAKENGMKSLALTDHGVMYGAHKFYQTCKYEDIKPIIGCEVYIAPRKMTQKVAKLDEKPYHLVLLAENDTGYKNLIKLVSMGFTEGFYYRPRIDLEHLREHSEGLIGLSACLGGEVARNAHKGKVEEAAKSAQKYNDIFGKDNFFIEIQKNGLEEQTKANKILVDIAEELKIPKVATTDSHYINKDDALAQEVLMCISTGKRLEDTKRLTRESDEFYMKTPEEMKKEFSDHPDALKNTELIAERCNVDLDMKDWILPNPPIPNDYDGDYDKYLHDLMYQRGKKVLGRELKEEEKKRAEYEFKIIKEKGFSKYMLMVSQFTDWIHENNVPHTTRGSAAGSLLAYFIGIVNANPLKFNLAFERFLNPLRPKAPDIDLDLASTRREELIEYAVEQYGKESTAHIITFGRMQARGSIRDAGRVLGLPLGYVDRVAKMIPTSGQGLAKVDIDKAIDAVPELKQLIDEDPDAGRLIDTAKRIEGVAKSQGVHACGILITPGDITDYVPVIWDKDLGREGRMITQYEMDSLEDLGLIKMDFLGLTNLDTIRETVKIVRSEKDQNLKPKDFPLDDEKTYDLIKSLDTLGVFQFETDTMKSTLKILQPENIFDVSAALALVRPGPNQYQNEYADRKAGKKPVTYLDPRMKEFLQLSHGVLVYQEDIIRTVINLGGMDWKEADRVRKATGKKKPDVLFEMKDELIERFMKHGMEKKRAEMLFELFVPFTNYAFNQAHAAAYSLIVYQTAYLKAHYPIEFMAALLKSELDDFDKVGMVISECNKKGIEIRPPDINKSFVDFSIEDKKNIRFGLAGIKNLGNSVVKEIVKNREEGGRPYENFDDFLNRLPLDKINQKAITWLIKVGALDQFGERNSLLATLPAVHEKYKKLQEAKREGQLDIFDTGKEETKEERIPVATPLAKVEPAKDSEKIEWEKELLGMYITTHPVKRLRAYLDSIKAAKIKHIREMAANKKVKVGAIVTGIKRITTKKDNRSMAFVTIEDTSGEIEMILFPDAYEKLSDKLAENTPMIFIGKVNVREGEHSLICNDIKEIESEKAEKIASGLHLKIPQNANKESLKKLKQILKESRGDTVVTISIPNGRETKTMQLKHGIEMSEKVEEIVGPFLIK